MNYNKGIKASPNYLKGTTFQKVVGTIVVAVFVPTVIILILK